MSCELVLAKLDRLIDILRDQGEIEQAALLERTVRDRFLWDQMALEVSDQLRSFEARGFSADVLAVSAEIISGLGEALTDAYEASVYSPVRHFSARLSEGGFPEWKSRIESALRSGSTGTEIFMGLKQELEGFLRVDCPLDLRSEAQRLQRLLQEALDRATSSADSI